MEAIRIGSRKSKLAVWQAQHVADLLEAKGVNTELHLIDTKGDKVQDVSIAKIGSKGVFTEELESMLTSGEVDIAVHSAKDLQSELPGSFEIIAFSKREFIDDVIVSDTIIDLEDSDLILGTSSTRRTATLKHFYPHIKTVDMRGNLQTRIQKMRSGVCQGLVLASAGVHRMEYDDLIKVRLPMTQFIPPVGQGALAIESHTDLDKEKRSIIRDAVNHDDTERILLTERAYLRKLEGGCSIPVFAYAQLEKERISIKGGILSLDGQKRIVHEVSGTDPHLVGTQLANQVLGDGGATLLAEIKKILY